MNPPIPDYSEAKRHDYPLTPESIVLDCGAYHGNWSREIARRYGCRVFAFEPCATFHELARLALKEYERVRLFPFAVGGEAREMELHVQNDSSGEFANAVLVERVQVVDLLKMLDCLMVEHVDLLKINIEGGEFELLDTILARGQAARFTAIQVQWHTVVPEAEARQKALQAQLLSTHRLAWGLNPFLWQNYELRK